MTSWLSSQRRKTFNPFLQNNELKANIEKKQVYVICANTDIIKGGSYKYILDLIKFFPQIKFTIITNIAELQKYSRYFNSKNILIFQNLFFSYITFKNIYDIVKKTGINLVIPIHDFYFISSCINECNLTVHNSYIHKQQLIFDKIDLLQIAKYVIFPSIFVRNEFFKYIGLTNYVITPHIDNKVINCKYIPEILNNTINIGIINELSEVKGVEYYKELFKIKQYKDYILKFHIFTGDEKFKTYSNVIIHSRYNNEEILNLLTINNINSLTFLNKWAETYCYSLTHALRSGLSIIYSNIGAFIERIPQSEHYFPVEANIITKIVDLDSIVKIFYKQLDYIIESSNTINEIPIFDTEIIIPDFYKKLFE